MKSPLSILMGFLLLVSGSVYAKDKFVFSGSLPRNSYQPIIIIPLLTEAFRRNGHAFEFSQLPAKRSLIESNSGRTDGEIHRVSDFHKVSNNQFPNLIRIESKMLSVFISVFANKDLEIENTSDLSGLIIAYKRGEANTRNLLTKRYPEKNIYPTNGNEVSFNVLMTGRVDALIAESVRGNRLISSNSNYKNIIEIDHIQELHIYSYIHRKHSDIGDKIAATLETMKQDGTFARITAESIALFNK